MKRIAQVLTVMFGLVVLVAYVVYSQRHQTKGAVAPSSKLKVLTGSVVSSNAEADTPSSMVAPGPKSAPVFEAAPAHDGTVVATNQVKP